VPYIRQSYSRAVGEGDLDGDSGPITESADIPFWGTALQTLYSLGFHELEEARAAGLVPPDWDVDADTPAWFSPMDRTPYFESVMRNNRTCLRIAPTGPICPHCGNGENIRFIDRMPLVENLADKQERFAEGQTTREYEFPYIARSHFICSVCGRSFGQFDPEGIQTRETSTEYS
jgi:hypothetical protein